MLTLRCLLVCEFAGNLSYGYIILHYHPLNMLRCEFAGNLSYGCGFQLRHAARQAYRSYAPGQGFTRECDADVHSECVDQSNPASSAAADRAGEGVIVGHNTHLTRGGQAFIA